jgi:hypothetical protein
LSGCHGCHGCQVNGKSEISNPKSEIIKGHQFFTI